MPLVLVSLEEHEKMLGFQMPQDQRDAYEGYRRFVENNPGHLEAFMESPLAARARQWWAAREARLAAAAQAQEATQ